MASRAVRLLPHAAGGNPGYRIGRKPRRQHASRGATMIAAMNYHERIVRDPQIVGGVPVLKGTRVTLKTVLASLAEGATTTEILADPPRSLTKTFERPSPWLLLPPGGSAVGRNAGQTVKIKLDENLPERLVPVLGALAFLARSS